MVLSTVDITPEENARRIIAYLEERGFFTVDGASR
jgi:hypothetical protein